MDIYLVNTESNISALQIKRIFKCNVNPDVYDTIVMI